MAGSTPVYAFPYQGVNDSPNGPDLGQDLAEAVEAALQNTDANVAALMAPGVLKYLEARSSADETVTTTEADVNGATLTFNTTAPNTVVKVTSYWDVATTGGTDTFIGKLMVDGAVNATGEAHVEGSGTTGRTTHAQGWTVTLVAAGAHTLKLRRVKAGAADTVTLYGIHTKIQVEGLGLA